MTQGKIERIMTAVIERLSNKINGKSRVSIDKKKYISIKISNIEMEDDLRKEITEKIKEIDDYEVIWVYKPNRWLVLVK